MSKAPTRKYTDPELRERLKNDILESDRGGKPGQWSARKSQLLVREYERHGGGYRGGKDDAARSLEHWTEQDWQTVDGDERARHDGSVRRYLPKAVWNALSPDERREAEQSKVRGSKDGKQHVDWPPAVQRAIERAERQQEQAGNGHAHGRQGSSRQELYAEAKRLDVPGRSRMKKTDLERAVRQARQHR